MDNNVEYINNIKSEKVPTAQSFISFDVKSLFTNFPLDYTINIKLRRIYDDNELYTNISKKEMKEILLLCTKNAHFTFNNEMKTICTRHYSSYKVIIYLTCTVNSQQLSPKY